MRSLRKQRLTHFNCYRNSVKINANTKFHVETKQNRHCHFIISLLFLVQNISVFFSFLSLFLSLSISDDRIEYRAKKFNNTLISIAIHLWIGFHKWVNEFLTKKFKTYLLNVIENRIVVAKKRFCSFRSKQSNVQKKKKSRHILFRRHENFSKNTCEIFFTAAQFGNTF